MLLLVLLSVFGLAWGMNSVAVGNGYYATDCRMAMSADGTKMVAGTNVNLYTSTDSGATWTQSTEPGTGNWQGLAMSADGSKISAAPSSPTFWISDNGSENWRNISYSSSSWTATAMSDDGSVIVVASSSEILTSTDGGLNWTKHTAGQYVSYRSVASTANGSYLAAVAPNTQVFGGIFLSTANWETQHQAPNDGNGIRDIALSADGMIQIVAVESAPPWVSFDMGASWTEFTLAGRNQYDTQWLYGCNAVALSADGSKMFACCTSTSNGLEYAWLSGDGGTTWGTDPNVEFDVNGCWSASLTTDGSMGAFSGAKDGQAYVVTFAPVYPTTTTTSTASTATVTTATVTTSTASATTKTETETTYTDTTTATATSTVTVTATVSSTATSTGTATTTADTSDPTDETTTTLAPVPTVVEVSMELTVDDPTVITENETLKEAMVDGFASAMGVDPSQVTVEFVEVNALRRLGTRRLSTTLVAIFKVTLPSAQAAEEAKASIEQVSVTDTNTAIAKAVADVGYTGTLEVSGKTATVVTTTTTTTTSSGSEEDDKDDQGASDATSKVMTTAFLAVSLSAFL
ncbi:unnamed protein product [Symbiodinium sp. CCMP2592]|nr:unnamed protein product [Symbiodinium sp. CCMP2592]